MSDLLVSYDELVEIKKNFAKLSREFTSCGAKQDSMAGAYGNGNIISAMEEFVDNWDDHRKELLQQMGDAEKRVKEVIKGFKAADGEKE
ncbi:hypothetical protein [Streptomyces sp. bgisy100]|uniref:hypothetical protein n=1 Tax=Streptomyces sp. bgisy100 TaxID=3413783 RepID=UPI003D719DA9